MIKIKTLDNKLNKVGDELKVNIEKGSKISIISSYFSIYAFKDLKKELSKIDELRFIFSEPMFQENEQNKIDNRVYSLESLKT